MIAPPRCHWAPCGQPIARRLGESFRDHRRRRYCSRDCFQRAAASHGKVQVIRPTGSPFPHAHYRTWADVPPRCPRDAGAWRTLPLSGVVCVLCGHERLVAEALLAGFPLTE